VGGVPVYENAGTTTINIAGIGTATFNGGDSFGALSEDITANSINGVGMGDLTISKAIAATLVHGSSFYDLATSYTATDTFAVNLLDTVFSTTLGSLQFNPNSASGNGTFTAVLGAAVPEPSSMVLAGIASVIGLGAWARRRRVRTDPK
jgi:hypothetical protein